MNKKVLFSAAAISAMLVGCSTKVVDDAPSFPAEDLNAKMKSGALEQKSESFYIINDASSSMSKTYEGSGFSDLKWATKLSVSKALLNRMNKTIPEVSLSSGMRSFGFGPCLSWNYTKLNQPLQNYSKSSFENALGSMKCSSGGTPIANAIRAAKDDLANAPGNIALLLFSDGYNYDTSPVPALQELKDMLGDRLCVYTVWVGNENEKDGLETMNQLANIAGCGFSTTADAIASSRGMASFVETALFRKGTPVFATNHDKDGDGVMDSKDKCADTPMGAVVNEDGCWAHSGDIGFDVNSAEVKPEYAPLLNNVVTVMQNNPGLTIEVQGHTDSTGSKAYNQKLSERRAAAVKQEVIKHGIDGSRVSSMGFGETKPIAPNNTKEGRAKNRRVMYQRTDR